MGSDKTMPEFRQYEVIGRHVPTERDPEPKAYRIKLFTRNETQARSRFWYFIRRLEKKPEKVSKYGIWLRYDSRSGTTNMYKEYSALTSNDVVQMMYQEMAGRHRARFSSIHIIKVAEISADKCIRSNTKQFLKANIAFPLPHRIQRANKKGFNKGTKARLPCTFMQ